MLEDILFCKIDYFGPTIMSFFSGQKNIFKLYIIVHSRRSSLSPFSLPISNQSRKVVMVEQLLFCEMNYFHSAVTMKPFSCHTIALVIH